MIAGIDTVQIVDVAWMTHMHDLKSCQFCGDTTFEYDTEKEAADAWNRRIQ